MQTVEFIILAVSAMIGGALAFLWKSYNRTYIGILLAFSGAYMIGIIATHLLSWVYGSGADDQKAGIYLLAGFVFQLLFSHLSQGVEHGHFHKEEVTGMRFYPVYIGLCIHAFIEGLPISGYGHVDANLHHQHDLLFNHLLAGVALHKLPEAYVLALLMSINRFKPTKFWIWMVVFAMMSPAGALLGTFYIPDSDVLRLIMAFVVGSLLHIATTILFETESGGHHGLSWRKMAAVIAGITIALVV